MIKFFLCLGIFVKFWFDFIGAVAQIIVWVFRPNSQLKPAIVRMKIETHSEWALWILSLIIFLVPGSLVAKIDTERQFIYIHFFHSDDPDKTVLRFKNHFEDPLVRIFEEEA